MRIAELRESKGMTQTALADALGIDRSAIAKWETGAAMPRSEKLPALAKILGCTIEEILADEKNDTREAV